MKNFSRATVTHLQPRVKIYEEDGWTLKKFDFLNYIEQYREERCK
jgi:hypothetical protein